jgi:hypothetical protein
VRWLENQRMRCGSLFERRAQALGKSAGGHHGSARVGLGGASLK